MNKQLISYVDKDGNIIEEYNGEGSFIDQDGNIVEDINDKEYYMQFGDQRMTPSEFMGGSDMQENSVDGEQIIDAIDDLIMTMFGGESMFVQGNEEEGIEEGNFSGIREEAIKLVEQMMADDAPCEDVVDALDELISSNYGETAFGLEDEEEGIEGGLFYGSRQDVIELLENIKRKAKRGSDIQENSGRWKPTPEDQDKLEDFLSEFGEYLVDEDAQLEYKISRGKFGPRFEYKQGKGKAPSSATKKDIADYIDKVFFGE